LTSEIVLVKGWG